MNLQSEFEKIDQTRYMGVTLQFFLTVEILMTSVTYYLLTGMGTLSNTRKTVEIVYFTWIFTLAISLFPMALTTTLKFAKTRAVFRIAHLLTIISIFLYCGVSVVPPLHIAYYIAEFGYLLQGISHQRMDWPGKLIAEMTDEWQEWRENNGSFIEEDELNEGCATRTKNCSRSIV